MPAIGYVTKDENGAFKRQLKTLSIRAEIAVVANAHKTSDAQPDYRILAGDIDYA